MFKQPATTLVTDFQSIRIRGELAIVVAVVEVHAKRKGWKWAVVEAVGRRIEWSR